MASPIDKLYESIYGKLPQKAGTAYERLAAAAWKLLNQDAGVAHDTRIRGEISKSLYQIDVEALDDDGRHAGEAKDYTERDAKVGRSDLQKLGGALPDIAVDAGKFFSATGYTKPARQYASASEQIVGKKIELYDLREVVEEDLEGRIKKIVCKLHFIVPAYERSSFKPVWTPEGLKQLRELVDTGEIGSKLQLHIGSIVSADGTVLATIHELTSRGFGGGATTENVSGSWQFVGGHIAVEGHLIPIREITYEVAFDEGIRELVFEVDGKATLILKSEDGTVDKVLQDVDLKRVSFDENGNAEIKS